MGQKENKKSKSWKNGVDICIVKYQTADRSLKAITKHENRRVQQIYNKLYDNIKRHFNIN